MLNLVLPQMGIGTRNARASNWWENGDFSGNLFSGADDYILDFANNSYVKGGVEIANPIISTHSSDILALNSSGSYEAFAANVSPITDLGLLVVPTRTNIFLNSDVPASQTVAVSDGTQYTISVVGSGSIALSGAGLGTATEGSDLTITTSGTSLICTISGSLTYVQVEQGSFATLPIITTGSAVTRAGNQEVISGLNLPIGVEFYMVVDLLDASTLWRKLIFFTSNGGANSIVAGFGNLNNYEVASRSAGTVTFIEMFGNRGENIKELVGSFGTDYGQAYIDGLSPTPDTAVTYPPLNKLFLGTNHTGGEANYIYVKEIGWRTGFTPDTTSHAEMVTLANARA